MNFLTIDEAKEQGLEFIPFTPENGEAHNWPHIFAADLSADNRDANGLTGRESVIIYLQQISDDIVIVDDWLHTWSYGVELKFSALMKQMAN